MADAVAAPPPAAHEGVGGEEDEVVRARVALEVENGDGDRDVDEDDEEDEEEDDEEDDDGDKVPEGITVERIQLATDLLRRLRGEKAFFKSNHCRALRKALRPWVSELGSEMYKGGTKESYDGKIRKEKSFKALRKRQKELDRKYINKVALRKKRLETLNNLLTQGEMHQELPMIPDGAAECTQSAVPVKAITEGAESTEKKGTRDISNVEDTGEGLLRFGRSCYICKKRYRKLHHFYDQLCPDCAALNWEKRFQSGNMEGKVGIVTGGRVKIGFHVALKLLRAGCHTIVSTRFPTDAALRFSKEEDYDKWKSRLDIFGLDFRNIAGLQAFCSFILSNYKRLDVLVNNACQTIRRPTAYYSSLIKRELAASNNPPALEWVLRQQRRMMKVVSKSSSKTIESGENAEVQPLKSMDSKEVSRPQDQMRAGFGSEAGLMSSFKLTTEDVRCGEQELPKGIVDVNSQQLDLRRTNSWLLKIDQVETPELAEVFAINAMAPFILNSKLIPLMKKSGSSNRKFIINVSAMEGKFYRHKLPTHPHTNMAKAALNMMTRTCSDELAKAHSIMMNSVDTGWINDENPLYKAAAHAKSANFQTPIDEIDASARILDPVFSCLDASESSPKYGKFFKDYRETEW